MTVLPTVSKANLWRFILGTRSWWFLDNWYCLIRHFFHEHSCCTPRTHFNGLPALVLLWSFYKICLRLPGGVGAAPAGRPRCLSGGLPYPALQPLPESQDARCPIFRKPAWLRGSVEFSLPLDLAKIADPLHSEVIGMRASHWKIRNTTKYCICGSVANIFKSYSVLFYSWH